jgi:hypothetical protein
MRKHSFDGRFRAANEDSVVNGPSNALGACRRKCTDQYASYCKAGACGELGHIFTPPFN